jgi:hypothetical protein
MDTNKPVYYGVYRVLASGNTRYVARSATTNRKLADEIAADLTRGEVVMPDGSTKLVVAHPHIVKEIA